MIVKYIKGDIVALFAEGKNIAVFILWVQA